jgi:hypothetical protein
MWKSQWLGSYLRTALGGKREDVWVTPVDTEGKCGIAPVQLLTPNSVVRLDLYTRINNTPQCSPWHRGTFAKIILG